MAFIAIVNDYVIGHGFPELTSNGGFAILSGVVIAIFAFVGAEIATIAAAESKKPGEAAHTHRIFLIVAILPWNSAELGKSPFAAALGQSRVPGSSRGDADARGDAVRGTPVGGRFSAREDRERQTRLAEALQ